jgi:hypothetical protein
MGIYYVIELLNIVRVIKSRRMRSVGHVVCMCEIRNAYKILVRKPEGRDHGRSRCRMDFREVGWESVDRVHLAQDRD